MDDAISEIRDAYAAARTADWWAAYGPNFQKEVEEPFNQLRALLHDPPSQEAQRNDSAVGARRLFFQRSRNAIYEPAAMAFSRVRTQNRP